MVTVSLAHFMRNLDWEEGDCQPSGATEALLRELSLCCLRGLGLCECLPDELHVGLCKWLTRSVFELNGEWKLFVIVVVLYPWWSVL